MSAMWLFLVGCQSSWTLEDADGDGFTWLEGDCDDNDPQAYPSASEVCDSIDNDCDGEIDSDSPEALTWYGDIDGDGFAGEDLVVTSCEIPTGYTSTPTDCDDGNSAINPEATEYCNDIDDNCNGEIDEDGAIGGATYFADADGDGYGDPKSPIPQCTQSGTVANDDDCDDDNVNINPDASEFCDGLDNDCDGLTDDEDDPVNGGTTFYIDADADGYGSTDATTEACAVPDGYASTRSDCDDGEATIYPGSMRLEVPEDGVDVDCDGIDGCTDFSCDGRPDVVLPLYIDDSSSHELSSPVYLSTALTSSVTIATAGPSAGVARDIDGDGYIDLALATGRDDSGCEASSRVYWGDGTLTLDGYTELPTVGARDVLVDDLDSDGYTDVMFGGASADCTAGEGGGTALIYWGTPGGLVEDGVSKLEAEEVWALDSGDIDGDGEIDILACRHHEDGGFSTRSVIFWGDGGDFSSSTELSTSGCADQLLADLDGDGLLDVVFANYRTDSGFDAVSYIYYNDNNRFSALDLETLQTTAAWSVQGADLDGDGDTDLVFGGLVDESDKKNPIWELDTLIFWNDSGFSTSTALATPGSPHPAVADLDGDGLMEVVVAGYRSDDAWPVDRVTDSYIYWGSDGYDASGRTALETDGAWQATAVDFDEDGYPDLLMTAYFDGSTYTTDSRVYWGSASGFSDSNTTDLAGGGVYAAPVIAGE